MTLRRVILSLNGEDIHQQIASLNTSESRTYMKMVYLIVYAMIF